jgi:hypothetical protein
VTHVGSEAAYRIVLRADRPLVELLVSRPGLRPLVAVFRSRNLHGTTVIGDPTARDRGGC